MSGTSLDGIDVAVTEIGGRGLIRTLAFRTVPYPDAVRKELLAVSNAVTHISAVARLNFLLGELYAKAVEQTCKAHRIPIDTLELIGCHGQTVFHSGDPQPYLRHRVAATLQIGEPAVIAERLHVPVVSDFRPRDIAAGGKGAPLVPYVDYLLFRHAKLNRVALNIGGIANLTAIPAGAQPRQVFAFDTGPGNMVINALVEAYTKGRQSYDRGGRIAAASRVRTDLLTALLADRYYRTAPPKCCGREQYGTEFVHELRASGVPLPDLIATATSLTASTIALAIERYVRPKMKRVDELIVSGGGAHNDCLMSQMAALLPGTASCTSTDYGIDLDAKEAIAFALLAYETWRRRPANLPSATGASRPVILGKITPGNNQRGRYVI